MWPDADPTPRVLLGLFVVWLGATITIWVARHFAQPPEDDDRDCS